MDTAIETAYAMGKTAASVNTTNVQVTYHIQHTHGDYCYPIASMVNVNSNTWEGHNDDYDGDRGRWYDSVHYSYSATCSVCGRVFSSERASREGKHNYMPQAQADVQNAFYAHLTNGRCRAGGIKCGKSDGIQDITDVSTLGSGDNVISATITF